MTGGAPRHIDFRIKMPDQAGRRLLWEDKVEPGDNSEAPTPDQSDETAGFLKREFPSMIPLSAPPASAPSSAIEIVRRTARAAPASRSAAFAFS